MDITWTSSNQTATWQTRTPETLAKGTPDLTVTGEQHQCIKGFGGCFNEQGWTALQALDDDTRAEVLQQLFDTENGCAFSLCRVPIGANDYAHEWYSLSEVEDDYGMEHFSIDRDRQCLIPYIKEAQKINSAITLFASPWSPPVWMKSPKAYNYGRLKNDAAVLEAYALYFQKFVEAYAAEGITVEQVHVQNEPGSNQKFPSCVMPAEQMRDFIRDHLGPRFERENVNCEIWAGTLEKGMLHGWDMDEANSYPRQVHTILKDAEARRYIAGIGFQWDGKGLVQRTRAAWPDVPLMQTENECGDGQNTWAYALYVFDLMWHYFSNGVCAYTYWNMVLPEEGESTWGWKQNSMINVSRQNQPVYNPEFYVMKHFAHYVRPGARRLGIEGMWAALALAFRNKDGSTVVTVSNPYCQTEPMTLTVDAQPHRFDLPPRSINTITWG